MVRRYVRHNPSVITRRFVPILALIVGFSGLARYCRAQGNLGPITVGGGLRTSFQSTTPDGGAANNQFLINDVRLYLSGPVYNDIKFMFNTDYSPVNNSVQVLDAVARVEVSPELNFWAGRFLPPSDRADLYGPFFANEWNVYTDGVQDGYPSIFQGRDNGVAYWGTFAKKIKISIGGFDGKTATGNPAVIGAARVQIDFWDPEDGYYLNGSYYGDKNLLAIGGASQIQDGRTATTVDFLMERKLPNKGVVTIESEYSDYNRLGGYNIAYAKSEGAYVLGSYLFPKKVGVGQFEVLGKYAKANFTHGAAPDYYQKTGEFNVSYIIKQFNARIMSFYQKAHFNRQYADYWQAGIGLQVQI